MNIPAVIAMLLSQVVMFVSGDMVKELIEFVLEYIETKVANTSNQWDDLAAAPLIMFVRNQFGIVHKVDPNSVVPHTAQGSIAMGLSTTLTTLIAMVPGHILPDLLVALANKLETMIKATTNPFDDLLIPVIERFKTIVVPVAETTSTTANTDS